MTCSPPPVHELLAYGRYPLARTTASAEARLSPPAFGLADGGGLTPGDTGNGLANDCAGTGGPAGAAVGAVFPARAKAASPKPVSTATAPPAATGIPVRTD